MTNNKRVLFPLTLIATAITLSACDRDKVTNFFLDPDASMPANVLLSNNRLGFVDADRPDALFNLQGQLKMPADDPHRLVSIDRRPQNGFLYALGYNPAGSSLRLYVVAPETLTVTPVGPAQTIPNVGQNEANTRFEMDFNPAVDRLRIISSLGENYRFNPNNGVLILTEGNVDGDLNIENIVTPAQGTAYTNSSPNLGMTTQYTLSEGDQSRLFIQNPPNNGTLTNGVTVSPRIDLLSGFDIAPGVNTATSNAPVANGVGYVVLGGRGLARDQIARINLVSGNITDAANLRNLTRQRDGSVIGLALQKPTGIPVIALNSEGNGLLRFSANNPGSVTTVNIQGITTGESLVGIDFRPATGELFALGVNPTANNGTLYRVDPQLGMATVIGMEGQISNSDVTFPDPSTTGYGFDFNPKVDRIRVTTSDGLNLRLNPNDGSFVAKDGDIKDDVTGDVTGGSAAAYTNSVAGTTATTLYILDEATSQLTIQSPPNDGNQINAIKLRVNGMALDFSGTNGFDIQSDVRVETDNAPVRSGFGFAALTVGGTTALYRINLVNGDTVNLGTIGTGTSSLRGLAVGQTHAR